MPLLAILFMLHVHYGIRNGCRTADASNLLLTAVSALDEVSSARSVAEL
jgi:hypothetical protein